MSKLFFLDLETTGLSPAKNGIHQISGSIVVDGETKESFDFKVQPNPKCIIEDDALKVAGVTREQIMSYPPMREIYSQLIDMLSKYVDKFNKNDKFFIVGYNNAAFDNNFFRGFFLQNGDNYFGSWFWSNTLDVMVMASVYLIDKRPQMPNFKLATVAEWMGIDVSQASLHDASYDIFLTKAIFDKITTHQLSNV
ncbi:MAG: exonuclease domain-containing protein [Mangrovibacterium sp.]